MVVEVFIPARFSSTRLPGKPLALIGGKPMIEWVYERASSASLVSKVTVATDDKRILEAVESFGGLAVMTSTAHCSGTERIAEAVSREEGSGSDIIVNLQGDEPLIEPEMIDAAIRPMLETPELNVTTLKTPLDDLEEIISPHVVKVVTDQEDFALYFSRSPIPYFNGPDGEHGKSFKHIGLYVYRRDFLKIFAALEPTILERTERLEQLRALENGYKIKVVTTDLNPISIDTQDDLLKVRRLIDGP